jgi:hypothetical protein
MSEAPTYSFYVVTMTITGHTPTERRVEYLVNIGNLVGDKVQSKRYSNNPENWA